MRVRWACGCDVRAAGVRLRRACGYGWRAAAGGVRVRRACGCGRACGELPSGWAGLVGDVTHRGQFGEGARRKASLKNKQAPQSGIEQMSGAAKLRRTYVARRKSTPKGGIRGPSALLCGSRPALARALRFLARARMRFAARPLRPISLCGSRPGLVRVMRLPPRARPSYAASA